MIYALNCGITQLTSVAECLKQALLWPVPITGQTLAIDGGYTIR